MTSATQVHNFTAHDIGSTEDTGRVELENNHIILTGESRSIWGSADNCIFYGTEVEGDFELAAQIDAVAEAGTQEDPFNVWAKAGIMVREDLDGGARNAALLVLPHRARLQRRVEPREKTGIADKPDTNISLPVWLRLQRTGNTITAFIGNDGNEWKQVGAVSLELPPRVHAGLTATNSEEQQSCQAVFSHVQIQETNG